MTICDMTIIFNFPKYDYSQYDNNFKKIVILENKNMTKKKPMEWQGVIEQIQDDTGQFML